HRRHRLELRELVPLEDPEHLDGRDRTRRARQGTEPQSAVVDRQWRALAHLEALEIGLAQDPAMCLHVAHDRAAELAAIEPVGPAGRDRAKALGEIALDDAI